jgi:hypothetical protein
MAIVSGQTATGTMSLATSTTATWGSNTTSGNAIIICTASNPSGGNGAVASISDSQSNLYVFAQSFVATGLGLKIDVWYSSNIIGGTTPTITAKFTRTLSGGVIAREYSGLAAVNSFDTGIGATASSSSPSSGPTPVATRVANEVLVGIMICDSVTPTISLGSGFSNLTLLTGGGSTHLGYEDQIVAAVGSQTSTFGVTSSANWLCGIGCFADTTLTQATTLNNYQFLKVGNGMSVSEKIR